MNNKTSLSLCDALNKNTVSELKDIAKFYKIKNLSKMKKNDIVNELSTAILSEENLNSVVAAVNEFKKFSSMEYKKSYKALNLEEDNISNEEGSILLRFGLAYREKDNFLIPCEVRKQFKKLDNNKVKSLQEEYHLIFNYIRAFANLYGVYEISFLTKTFNKMNPDEVKLSKSLFMDYFALFERVNKSHHISDKYVVSEAVLGEEDLNNILKEQEGKEYFIPEKEDIEKYSFNFGVNSTVYHEELKKVIRNFADRNCDTDDVFNQICMGFFFETPIENIVEEAESLGIILNNTRDKNLFVQACINVYNNTRMWKNKGYMPSELSSDNEITMKDLNIKIKSQQNMPIVKEKKIGRNDPCPCGSGKKYKKCCGRNL